MRSNSKHKKAQAAVEHAAIIAIVAAVLVTSQAVVKRAMQGRLKRLTDGIADQFDPQKSKVIEGTFSETIKTNEKRLPAITTIDTKGNRNAKTKVVIMPDNLSTQDAAIAYYEHGMGVDPYAGDMLKNSK